MAFFKCFTNKKEPPRRKKFPLLWKSAKGKTKNCVFFVGGARPPVCHSPPTGALTEPPRPRNPKRPLLHDASVASTNGRLQAPRTRTSEARHQSARRALSELSAKLWRASIIVLFLLVGVGLWGVKVYFLDHKCNISLFIAIF